MNKMNEIAKLLGVELNEEFKVKAGKNDNDIDATNLYRLTKLGLEYKYNNTGAWEKYLDMYLVNLIKGEYGIVKLPYKPKKGDVYYFPCITSLGVFTTSWVKWDNTLLDYAMLKLGMTYRTEQEARDNLEKDAKKLLGE